MITMAQHIEITIAPDGTVTTKVVGGCGRSCKDATRAIREALGVTTEDKALPEYYAEATQAETVRGRS